MEIMIKFLICFAVLNGVRSEDKPFFINKCKHEDKDCIARVSNDFFSLTGNGIPEIGLVPTNPYKIPNLTIETGGDGPVSLKINFEHANMVGIHLFHIDKVVGFDKDPKSKKEFTGSIEMAGISGPYQISGKFLLLPISGEGQANIIIENAKLQVQIKTDVETRNGKDYLIINKVIVRMEPEKLRVNFENLFNNKELSDNMNSVLNENSALLYKEVQAPIQKILGDAVRDVFASAIKKTVFRLFLRLIWLTNFLSDYR